MIKRHITRGYHLVRPVAPQILRYLIGGFTAAGAEIGSFQLMLLAGIPYIYGGPVSGLIGILTAFLVQKYFVFKKSGNITGHGIRYALMTGWNYIAQNAVLIGSVELLGVHPLLGKVLSIGLAVSWNFLLYKFFVYV